jgi:hypothetical protein
LASVFAGDAVYTAQHIERAKRDVAEVADGSGDEVEAGSELWVVGGHGQLTSSQFADGTIELMKP